MATKKLHISYIQKILNRGAESDDKPILDSVVSHALDISRSLVIKRQLDKHHNISDFNYQTICVSLEEVDPTTCSLPFSLPSRCKVLRSTSPIPKPLNSKSKELIQVQYLDGRSIGFLSQQSSHRAKYSLSNLTSRASHFFKDSYLYIIHNPDLLKVQVRGIFEDPLQANSTSTCEPTSTDYPIDQDLLPLVYQETLASLSRAYQFPSDTQNNTLPDETIQKSS